jgi:hypothetical protein
MEYVSATFCQKKKNSPKRIATKARTCSGDKERDSVRKLGAHKYLLYLRLKDDPYEKLKDLGGADLMVTMAPNLKAMSEYDRNSIGWGLSVSGSTDTAIAPID